MNLQMLIQSGSMREAFFTLQTGVGLLPRVKSLMSQERRILGEAFPALLTVKGLLSRVNSQVFDQIGFPREAFAAFRAYETFLARVDSLVLDQVGFFGKTFPAEGTRKRFFPRVASLMDQEFGVLSEQLIALQAGEDFFTFRSHTEDCKVGRSGRTVLPIRGIAVCICVLEDWVYIGENRSCSRKGFILYFRIWGIPDVVSI